MKALVRLIGHKVRYFASAPEIANHYIQWQIRKSVGVVCQKFLFSLQIGLYFHEPLANIGSHTGIYKRDIPIVQVTV
jgi:hypothetical protein